MSTKLISLALMTVLNSSLVLAAASAENNNELITENLETTRNKNKSIRQTATAQQKYCAIQYQRCTEAIRPTTKHYLSPKSQLKSI